MAAEPQPGAADAPNDDDDGDVQDLFDDILEQYRFNWEPDYRLKFKKQVLAFKLGACLSKPHENVPRIRLTAKPADERSLLGQYFQKALILPQQKFLALYSKKISIYIFRLQFVAGYSWSRRTPSLDYRITTKWSDGFRMKKKERCQVSDKMLLRCKWNLDMQLPDLEGHLGGPEGPTNIPALDIEPGRMDFDVTQLDFVCDLDGFPKAPLKRTAVALSPTSTTGISSPSTSGTPGELLQGPAAAGNSIDGKQGRSALWPGWLRGNKAKKEKLQMVLTHDVYDTAALTKAEVEGAVLGSWQGRQWQMPQFDLSKLLPAAATSQRDTLQL